MKIHLMIDSVYTNNFIKTLIEQGRINENKFLIVYYGKEVKYLDEDVCGVITLVRRKSAMFYKSEEYKMLCGNIKKEDSIFIHYLSTEFVWTVIGTKAKEYSWILWGGDFYPYCKIELFDDQTKDLLSKLNYFEQNIIKSKIKEYISLLLRKRAIKKIDKMLTWNDYDYQLVKEKFSTNAKLQFFMYPKVNNYELLDRLSIEEKNTEKEIVIQIGNSGSSTNNHVSVLKKLQEYKDEKKLKIIMPLSYGEKEYINEVIKEGKRIFNDKFNPITSHIPLKEYYSLLNSVDIAIMNHHRQEGAGNIITLLYLGKKVYFNEQVTTYKIFKEWGLNIYKIDDIGKEDFNNLIKIDRDQVMVNKRIIKEKFNDSVIF